MKVYIETIPHKDQAYPTTGDYYQGFLYDDNYGQGEILSGKDSASDVTIISVSDMGDWRYEALVGHHEYTELLLCKAAGISFEEITAFDLRFEKIREQHLKSQSMTYEGADCDIIDSLLANQDAEPGDCIAAPYYKQHQIATGFERIMAAEMGVDWNAYEDANLRLYAEAKDP